MVTILKLISWNVNGLRAIAKKGLSEWLEKESPDILCLQETKAWKEQLDKSLTDINGYFSFFGEAEKKGYSGTAIYSKIKPLSVSNKLGQEEFDSEGRIVIAEYPDFVLLNVYFPNGKRDNTRLKYKLDFYDAFLSYILKLREKGKKIIFCGDVNTAHKEIDLARPKENQRTSGFLPEERAWIDKVIEHGFIDTLRLFTNEGNIYTWWDMITRARERNVGWRIDYFFVSEDLKQNVINAFTMPEVMGSDHCPVGLEINFPNK